MEAALSQLAGQLLKTLFETEGILAVLTATGLVLSILPVVLWRLIQGLTKALSGLTATVEELSLKVNGLVTRTSLDALSKELSDELSQVDGRCHDLSVRLAHLEGVCEANTNYQGPRRRVADLV